MMRVLLIVGKSGFALTAGVESLTVQNGRITIDFDASKNKRGKPVRSFKGKC